VSASVHTLKLEYLFIACLGFSLMVDLANISCVLGINILMMLFIIFAALVSENNETASY